MTKINSIAKFNNSLTEYLINALTDKHGNSIYYTHKYHNLKVFMDPTEIPEPHFFVALGISQACFSLTSGEKLNGSIGEEDGLIKRWSERTNINKELKKHFQLLKDQSKAEDCEDTTKKALPSTLQRRTKRINQIQVDMTGTGINRVKKEKIEFNKGRFVNEDKSKFDEDDQD